jgi:RES domain-containing protein
VRLIRRGGRYLRIADPDWDDPLDGSYSIRSGGRWNAPGSFPVCYLSRDLGTARANARHLLQRRLHGLPITVDDLDPDELPVLVTTEVEDDDFVDVVTSRGCVSAGLPRTYPVGDDGTPVGWERCQPVGQAAWDAGQPGIAGRSAAEGAPTRGEELAWFQRQRRLMPIQRQPFAEWYGQIDWV